MSKFKANFKAIDARENIVFYSLIRIYIGVNVQKMQFNIIKAGRIFSDASFYTLNKNADKRTKRSL